MDFPKKPNSFFLLIFGLLVVLSVLWFKPAKDSPPQVVWYDDAEALWELPQPENWEVLEETVGPD